MYACILDFVCMILCMYDLCMMIHDARGRQRTSSPLQSITCCTCHAKTKDRTPSAAPATQKCRACHAKVLHLPRKMEAHAPCRAPSAALATQNPQEPKGRLKTPGRTPDPLKSLKCRACHAKSKHRGQEPNGLQGTPG